MTDQLSLLFIPEPDGEKGLSIQERFERFHDRNPWVYHELVAMARELRARRSRRIGIKMLFEVLRWQYYRRTDGDDEFKLNNNFHSRYARLIMESEPDLEGAFELRALHSE